MTLFSAAEKTIVSKRSHGGNEATIMSTPTPKTNESPVPKSFNEAREAFEAAWCRLLPELTETDFCRIPPE